MNLLPNAEVHVWHISSAAQQDVLSHCAHVLAPNEHSRASRFHFAQDRDRYIFARGTLRRLLARYATVAPAALNIEADAFGKPRLTNGALSLHFNLSHSQDQAVFAIARAPIGIDLEHIRPFADALPIAQAYFLPSETAWLHAQPPEHRERAFFQLWTCKEAYLKALGDGLSAGLNTIDTRPDLLSVPNIWHRLTPTHHIQTLTPIPNCACALVAPVSVTKVVVGAKHSGLRRG